MECGNLSLIWVYSQTVSSVVLCDFLLCVFYSLLYRCEGRTLDCDTKIVCIDETPGRYAGRVCIMLNNTGDITLPWGQPFFCFVYLLRSLFSST